MSFRTEDAGRMLPERFNTQENCQALVDAGVNAYSIGLALLEMRRVDLNLDLITAANFQALIAAGANAGGIGKALALTYSVNPALMTAANVQALIAAGAHAADIGIALTWIHRAAPTLMTADNFHALIAAGAHSADIGRAFALIHRAAPTLMTAANFQAIIAAGARAAGIGRTFAWIHRAAPTLMTAANFLAIIVAGAHAEEGIVRALAEMRHANQDLITADNFHALIAAGADAVNRARDIIRQAQLAAAAAAVAAAVLPVHERQSTHTASVHRSSSDSATRLMTRYGRTIQGGNLNTTLQAINDWAQTLHGEQESVKDCVARLTAVSFTFEDPGSHVSIPQLLALAWKALHDDIRKGTLEDGLAQFAAGLVEMQNEYGRNIPACPGGSFNKIIEKLVGIHPDVEQLVITSGQATTKLPIVVKEEAYKYLEGISSPKTLEELQAFTDLIVKIRAKGAAVIWPFITDAVVDRMIGEFGSIYNDSKDDAKFQTLLEYAKFVELDKLDIFQKQISESAGYYEWTRKVLRHSVLSSPPKIEGIITYVLPCESLSAYTDAIHRSIKI